MRSFAFPRIALISSFAAGVFPLVALGQKTSMPPLKPIPTVKAVPTADTQSLALPQGVKLVAEGSAFEGAGKAFKYRFENGMTLIVLPDTRNPVASLRITLNAGSNRESLGRTGLAHFFEHMMFRKTRGRDEGHYDRTLAGVGGNGNASTSTDYVTYESTFPGPALDTMLDLEAQRFRELDIQDPYFTTEKGAVISERKLRYENDPAARGAEVLRRSMEKGSPYEWLTIGTKEDIEGMSIKAATQFYADFYTPDNTIMSVGGPFPPELIVRKVHSRFGSWQGKAKEPPTKFPADYSSRNIGKNFFCAEPVFEKRRSLVFPSTDTSFESSMLMFAFSQLLNDHPEGTLQFRLSRENLATGFSIFKTTWQKQHQPYVVSFRMTPSQNPQTAERFFWKAFEDTLKRPIDAAFKSLLLKRISLDEATQAMKMTSMLEAYEWNEHFYGDFLISKKSRSIVESLDAEKLRQFARSAFDRKKMFRHGVVSDGEATLCKRWRGP